MDDGRAVEELLSERELRHVSRLYGIGGLSYGDTATVRVGGSEFALSAVDDAAMTEEGDLLAVLTNREVVLSSPEHKRHLAKVPITGVTSLALSLDGSHLAVATHTDLVMLKLPW